jgi:HSP20 family protein
MPDEPRLFVLDLHRRVEEVFEELVYRRWQPAGLAGWRPPVDVFESETAYLVEIDLPGVPPEDVRLVVDHRTLTVVGQRSIRPPAGARSGRCERARGSFRRVLEFPAPIDPARATAAHEHGTYSITLPKHSPNEPPPPLAPSELVVCAARDPSRPRSPHS